MNSELRISQGRAKASTSLAQGSRISAVTQDGQRSAFDRLVAVLQEKYRWNRERAAKELLRRLGRQRAGRTSGGSA